jgi:hypothetical protein
VDCVLIWEKSEEVFAKNLERVAGARVDFSIKERSCSQKTWSPSDLDCGLVSKNSEVVFAQYTKRASGARVDIQKIDGFFLQNDHGSIDLGYPCAQSNGREKRVTWPRWPASFWRQDSYGKDWWGSLGAILEFSHLLPRMSKKLLSHWVNWVWPVKLPSCSFVY